MTREELYKTPIPIATQTYSPVSHREIIEKVYEELDKRNIHVSNETLMAQRDNMQLIGYLDIHAGDPKLGMRLAFRNSYDKSMSVAFVAGASVWICGNGMVNGEIQYVRKHTGAIAKELESRVVSTIERLETNFNLCRKDSETMKLIKVDKTLSAELCGRLFIEEEIITSTQLNVIKRELTTPTFSDFEDPNLWSLYNHITYAMKESHPTQYLSQHLGLHKFVQDEFNLVTKSEIYAER